VRLPKFERKLVAIVIGSALIAVVSTGGEAYWITSTMHQYAQNAAFGLQQYCGAVAPDGNDVAGLVGITNPSSVAVDASWAYDFYFSIYDTIDAWGAVSVHVPAHGTVYVAVRFYRLAPFDQSGTINSTELVFTSNYHVMIWSFDKMVESSGKMAIPFTPPIYGQQSNPFSSQNYEYRPC
jgi:hypothetical protein